MAPADHPRPGSEGLTSQSEDYLEAIAKLQEQDRVARAKDIAERLGVTPGTVTSALRGLSEKGLINYQPYSHVTLTPEGERLAADIIHRHDTLTRFLREVLHIPPGQAEENACRAEHVLGCEVIARIACLMEFLDQLPRGNQAWREGFERYCAQAEAACQPDASSSGSDETG